MGRADGGRQGSSSSHNNAPHPSVLVTCRECGVEFMGGKKERYCPMCKHERINRSRRAYRRYLKKNGWCYDCGMPVKEGRTRCEKCLRKIADKKKKADAQKRGSQKTTQ